MTARYAFICATLIVPAFAPAAIARCWDTGHSIQCAPGCELLKPPHFPGDLFTWRCRRHTPPLRLHDARPPPSYQPPVDGCGPGMYAATPTWCCEIGSVYRNGRCQFPARPRTYEASGPLDPTVPLGIVGLMILAGLSWYDHHNRQIARARGLDDAIDEAVGEARDADAAARRMHQAADEADEILRRFRHRRNDEGAA